MTLDVMCVMCITQCHPATLTHLMCITQCHPATLTHTLAAMQHTAPHPTHVTDPRAHPHFRRAALEHKAPHTYGTHTLT